jgi:hypothetical protein
MLRLEARNITGAYGENIGTILFADSFFLIEQNLIHLTKNVPKMLNYYSSNKHYENLYVPVVTERKLNNDDLEDRLFYYTDMMGLLPYEEKSTDVLGSDYILNGKLVCYVGGMIFVDIRLNAFVLKYSDIEAVNYHLGGNELWADI